MEVENDWFVGGEDCGVFTVRQAMWMVAIRYQLEEIDDVNETDLEIGQVVSQERRGSESFLRRNISATRHYHIRFRTRIV